MMATATNAVLALDVGEVRIGVAIARAGLRLAQPLTTLIRNDSSVADILRLAKDEAAGRLVIGLPRGLDGQATEQTARTERFVQDLRQATDLPISLQDEALTSVKAEAELKARNKSYDKPEIDALAATYILEDYLNAA